jgi:hypothetical protein
MTDKSTLEKATENLYTALVKHYEDLGMEIPRGILKQLSDVRAALFETRGAAARTSGMWRTSVPVLPLAQAIVASARDDEHGIVHAWTSASGIRRHNALTMAGELSQTLRALGYALTPTKDLPKANIK